MASKHSSAVTLGPDREGDKELQWEPKREREKAQETKQGLQLSVKSNVISTTAIQ